MWTLTKLSNYITATSSLLFLNLEQIDDNGETKISNIKNILLFSSYHRK